jgi:uncharacterized protein (TIGR03083 family)
MIATAHLYGPLHAELMRLLRSLTPAQWVSPTICRGWSAQDIAAHILDTQTRILSMGRDGYTPPPPEFAIDGWQDLVRLLDGLNADWIRAARRMSPAVLMDLLDVTGPQLASHVEALDPEGAALFPVAWASGPDTGKNWFDIGRNYTEYWHHQQQIRDAVGAEPLLMQRRWLHPVIALFLHAVPRAFEGADGGSLVEIQVTGEAGGVWRVVRCDSGSWTLHEGAAAEPTNARIELSDDTAWRFLTKGLTPEAARPHIRFAGDLSLTEQFLRARAIMG